LRSNMNPTLTTEELGLLRAINTPTLANAIELLKIRARGEGFTREPVRCMFPDMGVTVGYAVTAAIRSRTPSDPERCASLKAYWDHLADCPAPRFAVVQELDQPPAGA